MRASSKEVMLGCQKARTGSMLAVKLVGNSVEQKVEHLGVHLASKKAS